MLEKMEASQPLTLDACKTLASEFGLSYRSVISKAKQMKYEYIAKTATSSKVATVAKETKAEVVADIEAVTNINFVALDKANMADLCALREYLEPKDLDEVLEVE